MTVKREVTVMCNRCGRVSSREVDTRFEYYPPGWFQFVWDRHKDGNADNYHLCDECTKEFEEWMFGSNVVRGRTMDGESNKVP
jgi:hypothetical protein